MSFYQDFFKKQKILKKFIIVCQHLLHSDPTAEYVRKSLDSRLSRESQSCWRFGYFPTDNQLKTLTSLIPKSDLEALGFCYPKFVAGGVRPHGHFSQHNLIMPFTDAFGNIVAVLGRSLLSEEERVEQKLQKYKYSTGCQKDLYVYGLDVAKPFILEKDCVIGVEGQFDCIALHEHGIQNAVAFGWANASKYQLFQVARYTNNIILMFDNDKAGMTGKQRLKTRYVNKINIKTISPPEGFKDIDEFFRDSKDTKYINYVIDKIKSLS